MEDDLEEAVRQRSINFIKKKWGSLGDLLRLLRGTIARR
jgi:hypothetical protein